MTIKKGSLSGLAVVISLLVIMGMILVAKVETTQAQQCLSYSAKFVCGPLSTDHDVVRGQYMTAVNIHNPHMIKVAFVKKAVIANSEDDVPGKISHGVSEFLEPDQAMYVDCDDIRSLFLPTTLKRHIEGFVVIMVPPHAPGFTPELDVWAKYTARHRDSDTYADVESIDVEEIHPKTITCP